MDYHELNKITIKEIFLIHIIGYLLDGLHGKYFSPHRT